MQPWQDGKRRSAKVDVRSFNSGGNDGHDSMKLVTSGWVQMVGDSVIVEYTENLSEDNEITNSILKVSPSEIELRRSGFLDALLLFRQNEMTLGMYHTPFMDIDINIKTRRMSTSYNGYGGAIALAYDLLLHGSENSDFKMRIKFKIDEEQ